MIVCINCSVETKNKMDSLLLGECYKDYSELVAMAVENLWMLEQEIGKKGSLVIGENQVVNNLPKVSKSIKKERSKSTPSHQSKSLRRTVIAPSMVNIPKLFSSMGLDQLNTPTVDLPSLEYVNEIFTLDRWLFGQYNKLLPAKVNCRALTRLLAEGENPIPLDLLATQIAEAAALLGDYLTDYDGRHQVGRDDSLATAFPRTGLESEKSRFRYANQFVGSVNNQGVLSGLLCDYRLAVLAPGEDAHLQLTEAAVQLAQLTNPVLDDCQKDPTQKFSPEEVALILDHILKHVPVEAFAFRTLIKAITDGANTPDVLNEALSTLVPTDSNRSLSSSFLTSQRSGAISRMTDLGLITRLRRGVKVSYIITQKGEAFIADTRNCAQKENR